MSLTYKLFKKPKTLDEFLDKIRKEGQTKININFGYLSPKTFVSQPRRNWLPEKKFYAIQLESGKTTLELYYSSNINIDTILKILGIEIKNEVLRGAIEIAEEIKNNGLEVTIDNELVEKSKNLVSKKKS